MDIWGVLINFVKQKWNIPKIYMWELWGIFEIMELDYYEYVSVDSEALALRQ